MVADDRGVQQALVRLRRFAQLADEGRVQVDRAPELSGQRGQLQPQAGVRVDPQNDLLGSALVGWGRKASRGVRRRNSRTSVTLRGSALPARRKIGTSAQRQLSISSRRAT
jgi:hypothetical protein